MLFGRQLTRGIQFGRQLGAGAKVFGRKLSSGAGRLSSDIGKAQRVINTLERKAQYVPVINTGLRTIGSALKGARDITDLTATGGQALTNLARGDWQSLKENYRTGRGLIKDLGASMETAGTSAAQTAGGLAFL